MQNLGAALGRCDEGKRLGERFSERIAEIKKKAAGLNRPAVLFLYGRQPMVSVAAGAFADDLIRAAGGRNVMAASPVRYPVVTWEQIVASKPEAIIISSMGAGNEAGDAIKSLATHKEIPAVASGSVHVLPGDLTDRPGPRLAEGLERMFELLHPEASH
jgi:iron complex transport system substrate-binding protein